MTPQQVNGVFVLSAGLLVRFVVLAAEHSFRQFSEGFLLMLFVAAWLGYVVLRVGPDGRGEFARLHFGKAEDFVPTTPEERLLLVGKKREPYEQSHVLWQSFFFQEGKGSLFESAKFAEFRVGHDGTSLLVGLADKDGVRLDAGQKKVQN